MSKQHSGLTDDADIHNPKGFVSASNSTAPTKNSSGVLEWLALTSLGATGPAGPAGTTLSSVSVSDIDDPTELNSESGVVGDTIVCYQARAAHNYVSIYQYDASDSGSESPPFRVDASGGGMWVLKGSNKNLVQIDEAPKLGGDLDTNGNDIITASNADLDLTPNGTGAIVAKKAARAVGSTLTDAATIAIDASLSNVFTVTLAGNRSMGSPTNLKANCTYIFIIKQDATGTRTLSYASQFKFESGLAPTLSTGSNDVDILSCVSDGTNLYCQLLKDFS